MYAYSLPVFFSVLLCLQGISTMSDAAEKEKSLTTPAAPLSNPPSESGEDHETKRKKKLELNRVASRVSIVTWLLLLLLDVWIVAS